VQESKQVCYQKIWAYQTGYNYTDSETIQAIMEELPDSWASIINPQYLKSIYGIQNEVKCHGGNSGEAGISDATTTTLA